MNIIGHQKQRALLKKIWTRDHAPQSYVLVGPRGVGKSLVAREFAYAAVSETNFSSTEHQVEPLDVLVLAPEQETKRGVTKEKEISVEALRRALRFLSRYPLKGRFRALIIEEAQRLSKAAQNALLKTLEEPNPTSLLILVTDEVGALEPTVLSRLQTIRFGFVPEETLRVGAMALFPETAATLAPFFYTLGRPGTVIRMLRDDVFFEGKKERLTDLFQLSKLSIQQRLRLAETLSQNVPETLLLFEWWLPGLHQAITTMTDPQKAARHFLFLEAVHEAFLLLRASRYGARLLLEKLLLSV